MAVVVRVLGFLYSVWVGLLFIFWMIVFMPFIIIPVLIDDRLGGISFFFIRCWSLFFSIPSFIFFRRHGVKNIDRKKSYIFVSNHTSFMDAPAIPLSIPIQLRALGKKELSKIPIFGLVTTKVAVWVDRTDQESRQRSIDRLIRILNKGISIFVAPEGTRNHTNAPLLPFFNGPFRLAIETGVPIIPMIIHNAKKIMPRGSLMMKPGTVNTHFLEPIETKGLTEDDLPELKEKVFQLMKSKVETLDARG